MRVALLAILIFVVGCTEVTQTIEPSPVDVTFAAPGTVEPEAPNPPGSDVTITLEPGSVQVAAGSVANVTVIVRNGSGDEIPSTNISVNVLDSTVLRLTEIDGRILAFEGVAAGVTSVIVTASGVQTSFVATVV